MQLFEKCMDTALKIPYFIKKRRFPTSWRPLLKGSNLFLMQKQFFKHFSRGLQGVGDLLFFIKYAFFKAISMHFSNNCMHAPYTVQIEKMTCEGLRKKLCYEMFHFLLDEHAVLSSF